MHALGLVARVACVFGLLALVLYVLRRTDAVRSTRRTGLLQVLGTTRVGKGAALTVVRIGEAEYVLGVTDHNVTLLTPNPVSTAEAVPSALSPNEPAPPSAAADALSVPSPSRAGRLDAVALGARLGTALGARLAARRRAAPSTELSPVAVSTALASLQDEPAAAESEMTDVVAVPTVARRTRTTARPLVVADGPATPTSRHALRRAVARTDALRDEEHPWTRSCRPTSRSSARAALLD